MLLSMIFYMLMRNICSTNFEKTVTFRGETSFLPKNLSKQSSSNENRFDESSENNSSIKEKSPPSPLLAFSFSFKRRVYSPHF